MSKNKEDRTNNLVIHNKLLRFVTFLISFIVLRHDILTIEMKILVKKSYIENMFLIFKSSQYMINI